MEISTARLPFHPNIGHVLHHFIAEIPSPLLDQLQFDPDLHQSSLSVFLVMELLSFSLQQVISFRNRLVDEQEKDWSSIDLMTPIVTVDTKDDKVETITSSPATIEAIASTSTTEGDGEPKWMVLLPGEILIVLRDISNALCHLRRHRIAHRDIKPDNIVFRLSSSLVTKDSAMSNLCQPGITAILCDFGNQSISFGYNTFARLDITLIFGEHAIGLCYDFEAMGMLAMVLTWSPGSGMVLGGPTNYRSPEINPKFGVPSSYQLDYDKSDIFALGVILGNMMCGRPSIYEPKSWTLSHQITQVYGEIYPLVTQLLMI
jgi:serine/threonine protein kinase